MTDDNFSKRAREASGHRARVRTAVKKNRDRILAAIEAGSSRRGIHRTLKDDGVDAGAYSGFLGALKYLQANDAAWSSTSTPAAAPNEQPNRTMVSEPFVDFGDTRFKSDF